MKQGDRVVINAAGGWSQVAVWALVRTPTEAVFGTGTIHKIHRDAAHSTFPVEVQVDGLPEGVTGRYCYRADELTVIGEGE